MGKRKTHVRPHFIHVASLAFESSADDIDINRNPDPRIEVVKEGVRDVTDIAIYSIRIVELNIIRRDL